MKTKYEHASKLFVLQIIDLELNFSGLVQWRSKVSVFSISLGNVKHESQHFGQL